jgi:hypothetical protein
MVYLSPKQRRVMEDYGIEHKDYLSEWRELMRHKPDEVLESWTDFDGEEFVRTVEDRRYSVAGIFAIEGWPVPPSMDKYII